MLKKCLLITVVALSAIPVFAQGNDPVLMTVGDIDVGVSEFKYIYEKNNRDGADYSRESLDEYLDLYKRFKLKVQKARDLQLDTIRSLQTELEGYRRQLAKSFLNDKQITDKLTREAYERMRQDVRSAHILFRLTPNATGEQERAALRDAEEALARLKNGEDFAELAKEVSDDKTTTAQGGDLGFLSAMLPNGFYEMENALYTLEPGQVSDPVRTPIGYHIIKVIEKRPARGTLELSHILVRINKQMPNENAARSKIEGLYDMLGQGESFEELARQHSDDQRTAKRGGFIGKVGINEYDPVFEEAAFSLENPGDYSEPVKSRIGWHIIKLIEKDTLGSYEAERRQIEARMSGYARMEQAREAMIDNIKSESGFAIDSLELKSFAKQLTAAFHTFKWKVPDLPDNAVITFDDGSSRSIREFAEFARTNARARTRVTQNDLPEDTAYRLFDEFSKSACIEYEEKHLAEKYPEFAALMREYEEGILLFEVTKRNVWDKASTDTSGLKAFFEANRDDYMWPERAEVVTYTITSKDERDIQKGYKTSDEFTPEEWAISMNKKENIASFERQILEEDAVEEAGWKWLNGWRSPLYNSPDESTFTRVVDMIPPQRKEMNEARGYIIADYQDYLEKQWVNDLKEEYKVKVNKSVLKSLSGA